MASKKDGQPGMNVLKELCGSDTDLYAFLARNLYETPFAAISKKDLSALIEEGEQNGNFGPAVDKVIFEASQNPEEKEKYVTVIQSLAAKTIRAVEIERDKHAKEGRTDRVNSLDNRIKEQAFMSERAEDIVAVASKFYAEKLVELQESDARKAREKVRRAAESEDMRLKKNEETGRHSRRSDLRKMGRAERKEAKKREKQEHLAAEERKRVRRDEQEVAAQEEKRIEAKEQADREMRREERTKP